MRALTVDSVDNSTEENSGENNFCATSSPAKAHVPSATVRSVWPYMSPDTFLRDLKTHYCQQAFQSLSLIHI